GRRICRMADGDGNCVAPAETRPCNDKREQAKVAAPKQYPEKWLDEVLALGHRIGNHTQDHCHLPGQTNVADMAWELKTTQDILDRHICDGVFLFRAPYGEWNSAAAGRVNSSPGFEKLIGPINWDVDGEDWSCWQTNASPDSCASKYLRLLMA